MAQVLLIEDNADDRELTRRAIQQSGADPELHVAQNGEEAMDYLLDRPGEKVSPSLRLILLDLHLPRMSGLDVLRQIRTNAATRHLPVIVLTTSREEPDLLQSFTMGVSDYVIKPLDPARFTALYQKYAGPETP